MHSPLPFISLFSPFTILLTKAGFSLIELYSISYLLKSVLAVSSAVEAGVRKAKKIEKKGRGQVDGYTKCVFLSAGNVKN